jgi:hypothetical protein
MEKARGGRAMKKSHRSMIEKIPAIDVRELAKAGAFAGGERRFPYIVFRYPFLAKMRTFRYRADMIMRNCRAVNSFHVEWTRCNYGGVRPWFRCSCGRRVAKLYCGDIFIGCRICYEARYESQRLGVKGRAHHQACKIRLSLGGAPTIVQPFPERPRRMWRCTYDRLRLEAEKLEAPLRNTRWARRAPDYSRFSFS